MLLTILHVNEYKHTYNTYFKHFLESLSEDIISFISKLSSLQFTMKIKEMEKKLRISIHVRQILEVVSKIQNRKKKMHNDFSSPS